MRLYTGKVPVIARDVIQALTDSGDIEVVNAEEVRLDLEAVLKEYLRLEREVVDEAKTRMEKRALGYSNLGRVRAQVAKERGAPQIEDGLPYIIDQFLKMLFHSAHVEE